MARQTRTQWERRARELAQEHGTAASARYIGRSDLGGWLYKIPSGDHGTRGVAYHVVVFWPLNSSVMCDCMLGSLGRPCHHAGAALIQCATDGRAWPAKRPVADELAAAAYRDFLRTEHPAVGYTG